MDNTFSELLSKLGIDNVNFDKHSCCSGQKWFGATGDIRDIYSPIDQTALGSVLLCQNKNDFDTTVKQATEAFKSWRLIPAPQRGDLVRQIGNAFREKKEI